MCGIAGLISSDPQPRIVPALAAIEHRGRDDEGVYISPAFGAERLRACLGHRRLSIIDTSSAGHQPMSTEDGRFHISFNGELYNYRDLRDRLESEGETFRTRSDTEVLLKAFRRWGTNAVDSLNGMFAFAVWDDAEKELTLVRDHAGIKPLFYTSIGHNLVFGSEIKAILASQCITPELDLEALNQTLTFLWPVPPHTLFKNVLQLLPGHFLKWKDGNISIHKWWDLDLSLEEMTGSETDWRDRVLESLDRAVRMEMVADVPLGAFLSGGVDSSSLVSLMTRNSKSRVSTFTTGISEDDLRFDIIPNDVEWSRRVAEIFPVDHHESILTADVAELLPKLVRHQEAPVIDMAIPSYLISEQSRKNQKVMLSGMGGDEIFAGYPRHLAMRMATYTDTVPSGVRRPIMNAIHAVVPGGRPGRLTAPMRNAKKFARSAAKPFEERYLGFGTYFDDNARSNIYAASLRQEMSRCDPYRHHRSYFAQSAHLSPLNQLLYVDFKTFMPALNLDTTDRTSMAANLEVRVPFLNREMLDVSSRLPSNLKIKGLKRKYILKRAAEQLLPKEIVWRKKAGFGAPVRAWLRGPLQILVNDLLSESQVRSRRIFDAAAVRRLIDRNHAGIDDLNLQIFMLIGIELWLREFIDQK